MSRDGRSQDVSGMIDSEQRLQVEMSIQEVGVNEVSSGVNALRPPSATCTVVRDILCTHLFLEDHSNECSDCLLDDFRPRI